MLKKIRAFILNQLNLVDKSALYTPNYIHNPVDNININKAIVSIEIDRDLYERYPESHRKKVLESRIKEGIINEILPDNFLNDNKIKKSYSDNGRRIIIDYRLRYCFDIDV